MKIVYISDSIIPSRSANSIHVMRMCQALAQNGNDVTLMILDRIYCQEPDIEDVFDFYGVIKCFEIIRFSRIPIKGRGYIYGWLAARKAKKMQTKLVYCRSLQGGYFSARIGLPVVFEVHQPVIESGNIAEWIFRRLIRKSELKKVVVITHALRNYYQDKYPFLIGKLMVAPDGADPIRPSLESGVFFSENNQFRVGYIGHLYSGRGMNLIMSLARYCPWADFHLIGGTDKDLAYWRKELAALNNIVFHGFISPNKLNNYRLAFDVLIAPYEKKVAVSDIGDTAFCMSPLKIFEYMAAGKAIIASDLPVLREVLDQWHTALLCPPENPECWVKALERLKEDSEFRNQLGESAKAKFLREFTWEKRAKNILFSLNFT